MDDAEVNPGSYVGSEKTIDTCISAGSTLNEDDIQEAQPHGLIQHAASIGKIEPNHDANDYNSNTVTITKMDQAGDSQEQV